MKKTTLFSVTALILITGIYGCKKVNGINNKTVIETPYSLYFSDTAGAIYHSNDGKTKKVVFPPDGYPCLAMCTSGPNILFAKTHLYISLNEGVNFNHSLDSSGFLPGVACDGYKINLNQSMLIDIPEWHRVYCVTNEPWLSDFGNRNGIRFNFRYGIRGSWDTEPGDTLGAFGFYGAEPYTITFTSFTMLPTGVLCSYDAIHNRNGYKEKETLWKETTGNPAGVLGIGSVYDQSGTPLPHCDLGIPDTSARYSLGHFNTRLFAIDNKGCYETTGYYSDDTGRNWLPCLGLPPNVPLLCISAPFEEICLVGTEKAGLYMLNLHTGMFEASNNGLTKGITVRNISFKENIFKNGTAQRYVYLATDKGIFQSTDGGHNWVLTIPGNYVTIY